MDPWKILPDEQVRYDQQFDQLAPVDGFLTGHQAREFFFKSNLPPAVLAKIWEFSDFNHDGKLDKREFSIAMHLIRKKIQGHELPIALPQTMLSGSSASSATSSWATSSLPDVLPRSTTVSPPSVTGSMPGNIVVPGGGMNFPQQFAQSSGSSSVPHMNLVYGTQPEGQRSRTGSVQSVVPVNDRPVNVGAGYIPTGEWAVPHTTKLKYNKVFHDIDKMRNGFLNGNQARPVLVNSGLPQPLLAQIWALADIDKDGRLSSEEFVLAMHLIEMAKQREPIPAMLPTELIPPSFRRPRGLSANIPVPVNGSVSNDKSAASSGSQEAMPDKFDMMPASFEDKRKENFDKGQAELERRRQAIQEMQRQEREERERREREEQERREKIRMEQERKRQAELEKQMARQREIEEKQEEERRKILEQREAARREMERQRKIDRQKQRRHELLNERTRIFEEVAHFRSQNSGMELHNVDTDTKRKDLLQLVEETRNQVRERKEIIDGMRVQRDQILEDIGRATNDENSFTEHLNKVKMERQTAEGRMSVMSSNGAPQTLTSLVFTVQQKKDTCSELNNRLSEAQVSVAEGKKRIDERNDCIKSIQDRFESVFDNHLKLLSSFQEKQTAFLQSQRISAPKVPETSTVVQPAFEDHTTLYPNLQNMQSAYNPPGQHVPDSAEAAWAENGFEVADDIWGEQSPFGEENMHAAPETVTKVSDFHEGPQQKTVVRTPSIKHDHHLSFDNDFKKTKFRKYRALYAYNAGNEDELSFQAGDVIYVPDSHDGEPGWLPGELNGKTGWLPENHVQFLSEVTEIPAADAVKMEKPVPKSRGNSVASDTPALDNALLLSAHVRARAIHPWNAKKESHLTFAKGDVLQLKRQADNWYFGETERGIQGWFPGACVEVLADLPTGTPMQNQLMGELKKTFQSHSSVDSHTSESGGTDYVAVFEYRSDVDGDLNFQIGETIRVVQKDGDWWTGKVGNRTGIFPSNYVKEHQEAPQMPSPAALGKAMAETHTEDLSKKKPEIVIAVAPYTAGGPEQISFGKGDMVLVKKKTETGWWEGELQAKGKQRQTGWFPAAYVKSLGGNTDSVAITLIAEKSRANSVTAPDVVPTNLSGVKVQAMYDYAAMNPDELSFKKNDMIMIVNKEDDNWWKGTLNGKHGILPSNYVQMVA